MNNNYSDILAARQLEVENMKKAATKRRYKPTPEERIQAQRINSRKYYYKHRDEILERRAARKLDNVDGTIPEIRRDNIIDDLARYGELTNRIRRPIVPDNETVPHPKVNRRIRLSVADLIDELDGGPVN